MFHDEKVATMKRVLLTGMAALLSISFAQAQDKSISFQDHRGQTIELEGPPERLATIIRAAPFIYYSTDRTTEHMVAVNADSISRIRNFFYADLIPELLQLDGSAARDGFAPNVEAILATNPQLVIQANHNPDLIEPLERVGLKVAAWGCCSEQQRLDYITMSGAISGHPERAEATLKLHYDSNARMSAKFADLADDKKVSLVYVEKIGDQIQVVANPSQDFSLSGIKNLAADDSGEWWKNVDVEQLFAWNPDVIIIPAQAVTLNPSDFYTHPLLSSMDAVKNRRVYKVPKFNASPDSPELFLSAVWLAMIAHPGMDAIDDDFKATIRNAYMTIYGRQPDDAQIASILEVEANGGNAGYAALFE
jgi:iron complex transport system substrate-binding protein